LRHGAIEAADLIGLDTVKAIAESLYDEFKEPLSAPPPLLNRMVDAGLLGRKTRPRLPHQLIPARAAGAATVLEWPMDTRPSTQGR
jgi:hypothetical protein